MNIYLPFSRIICHHFIFIKILNRGKTSVPTNINVPGVISSLSDKAKYFASIFASKSILDDKGHPILDFSHLTGHNFSNIFITMREVPGLIKSLDPNKNTGPDKIQVFVL